MKYFSTRDREKKNLFSLKEAAFMGLAPDGGLFVPEFIPKVEMEEVERRAAISYTEMALYLTEQLFPDEFESNELRAMLEKIYDFDCKLHHMEGDKYTLELFHGPTFAFKDFGAKFMGGMIGLLNKSSEELIVLTATSGDTGSAVANGFYNVDGIKVVVLYPEGKISNLQESQMTTLGGNIRPVKVNGTFDDCQALVKAVFNDKEFRQIKNITSANSINLLRWIPQSFYYFYGYCLWKKATGKTLPEIVVPSGNYGNLTAGMLATFMGLPVKKFTAASNSNDIIPKLLMSGNYEPKASIRTIANAMDVGNPSNYERMVYLYDDSFEKLTAALNGYSCDDEEIRKGIKEIYDKYGYVSDPHSAVGYNAAKHYDIDGFWLSTAHYAKFGEVIKDTLGQEFEIPAALKTAMSKPKVAKTMENDIDQLKDYILNGI